MSIEDRSPRMSSPEGPRGFEVRAPGKVVLLGEYAVLDGAPALVAAVNIGVCCRVNSGVFQVETPGDDSFVQAALSQVGAPPAMYQFSGWNRQNTRKKLGVGTSAAAVVAAVIAGRRADGRAVDPGVVWPIARSVHHEVQGSGSGIDVAASVFGGVLRFEGLGPPVPALLRRPLVLVWSGAAARTGPRVARYLSWADREAFVAASREVVDAFAADPIGAMEEARRLLERMAVGAGVAYRTPTLDAISSLAAAHGGAAKPSGAGGGDCAVALFPDDSSAASFEAACAGEGLFVIPAQLCAGAA